MRRITLALLVLALAAVAWPNRASTPTNLERTVATQEELVRSHPDDPLALNDLGNLLLLVGRGTEAETAYRRAIELAPDQGDVRFNLALLLQQSGRRSEAEKELRTLIASEPYHAWAHYQLGVILAARKQRDKALEHYARAFAYDPTLTFASNNPHIIENPLVGEALLLSRRYSETATARVPRHYGEPERIVEMMLRGGEAAQGEGHQAPAPKAEGGGAGSAAPGAGQGQGGGESEVPSSTNPDDLATSRLRGSAAGGGLALQGTRPGGATTRSGGQTPGATPPGRPDPTSGRSLPPPRTVVPPAVRAVPPPGSTRPPSSRPPSTLTPAPPPPGTRYVAPSRRSTAQLELRLLPEEDAPTAAGVEAIGP